LRRAARRGGRPGTHAHVGPPGAADTGPQAYEGHIYSLEATVEVERATRRAYDLLGDAAARLRVAGVAVERVSVGASAGARVVAAHPAVTELRAGSYIFNDLYQVRMGRATADEHGIISVPPGAPPFRVGERVTIIPNEGSVVVDSFSELVRIRAGRVERVWSIAARGCMQ
jgi:D-serine deaminase-like pyridoxal phosphate-dependent protein